MYKSVNSRWHSSSLLQLVGGVAVLCCGKRSFRLTFITKRTNTAAHSRLKCSARARVEQVWTSPGPQSNRIFLMITLRGHFASAYNHENKCSVYLVIKYNKLMTRSLLGDSCVPEMSFLCTNKIAAEGVKVKGSCLESRLHDNACSTNFTLGHCNKQSVLKKIIVFWTMSSFLKRKVSMIKTHWSVLD